MTNRVFTIAEKIEIHTARVNEYTREAAAFAKVGDEKRAQNCRRIAENHRAQLVKLQADQYNYNEIKSDSLQQVVKFFDNIVRESFADGYVTNDYRITCQCVGRLSGALDLLAEKMGELWLFGADFVEDADQLRAFCAFVIAKAEKLAEIAELDNINIVRESVANVEHWLAKGAETAAQFAQPTAGSATETANECHRLECRKGGALVEIATGETVGKWGTDEDGFYAQLDSAHLYKCVYIVNDPTEGTETATEGENETETTNTPAEGVETATESENEPQTDNTAAYNPDDFGGVCQELRGARYTLTHYGKNKVIIFHCYITPYDNMGQRTGQVEAVDVMAQDVETDRHGLPCYSGNLLFTDYASACRAADD